MVMTQTSVPVVMMPSIASSLAMDRIFVEHGVRPRHVARLFRYPPCHRMQNAHRVIHSAVGIHRHRESLITESPPYAVGKARPHKEHPLAGFNSEALLPNINYRPKLHRYKKSTTARNSIVTAVNYRPNTHRYKIMCVPAQLLLTCRPFFDSVISTKRALALVGDAVSICLMRTAASGSFATM